MSTTIEALLEAANKGDNTTIKKLLDEGVDVNSKSTTVYRDKNTNSEYHPGITACHLAVLNKHVATLKLLIERGADVNILIDGQGGGPLHIAANSLQVEVVEFLIQNGANVNLKTNQSPEYTKRNGKDHTQYYMPMVHGTPLHYAIKGGQQKYSNRDLRPYVRKNDEIVMKKNGEPKVLIDKKGLDEIIRKTLSIVQLLLANKADINATNYYGETVLHWCAELCADKQYETSLIFGKRFLEYFILHGANINQPVTMSQIGPRVDLYPFVSYGADMCLLKEKSTPLHYAMYGWETYGAQLLMDAGASPYSQDINGNDPFEFLENGRRGHLMGHPNPEVFFETNKVLGSLKPFEAMLPDLVKSIAEKYCKLTQSTTVNCEDPILAIIITQTANKVTPELADSHKKTLCEMLDKLKKSAVYPELYSYEEIVKIIRDSLRNRLRLYHKKQYPLAKMHAEFGIVKLKNEILQNAKEGQFLAKMTPELHQVLSMDLLDIRTKQQLLLNLIQGHLQQEGAHTNKIQKTQAAIHFLQKLGIDLKYNHALAKRKDKSAFQLALKNKAPIAVFEFLLDEDLTDDKYTYDQYTSKDERHSILSLAIKKSRNDVAILLCKKGVNVEQDYDEDDTPLAMAIKKNASLDVFKCLFEKGANLNDPRYSKSFLNYLEYSNDPVTTAKILIEIVPEQCSLSKPFVGCSNKLHFLLDNIGFQRYSAHGTVTRAFFWVRALKEIYNRFSELNQIFNKSLTCIIFEYTGAEFLNPEAEVSEYASIKYNEELAKECSEFACEELSHKSVHWMYNYLLTCYKDKPLPLLTIETEKEIVEKGEAAVKYLFG